MAAHSGSTRTVYAALIGNFLIAITKFVAAALTGSSAMLSEGVHSLVDTGNELLLLYGLKRAARPPDRSHPLGHGRELYFWSFIVALLVFALGAGVSFYEGVSHILDPHPVEAVGTTYVVLALSFVFEGITWRIALKQFRAEKGRLGYVAAMRRSKDPTTFTVLFEDSAALLGLVIAFAGIFAADRLGRPELDGVASLGIGAVLAATAIFLARESKGLLIGEPALPKVQEAILETVRRDAAVQHANGVLTVHLGPDQVVAAVSAEFEDELTAPEIEACIERLEDAVKREHPQVVTLFVKPQSTGTWAARRQRIEPAGSGD
ncbi:cation diffusion facilitator family transporter [Chelatococcus sp. GCM10030263]|uniref:cation diffusion facilitator family transporter n=1 Tax=Chelatococcus sp. GCM10030263 TaxID=3273387 RepID=UPI0036230B4A